MCTNTKVYSRIYRALEPFHRDQFCKEHLPTSIAVHLSSNGSRAVFIAQIQRDAVVFRKECFSIVAPYERRLICVVDDQFQIAVVV